MFIRKTLENCVYNILNENYIPGFHKSLEYLTGPPCLDYSVRTLLNISYDYVFVPGIYNFNGYRFHLLDGDLFANNILFKYENYLNDLKNMNIDYWVLTDNIFT